MAAKMDASVLMQDIRNLLTNDEHFSQLLVDNAHVIVLVLGLEAEIHYMNRYTECLLGYDLSEIKGSNWISRFVPLPEQERIRGAFLNCLGEVDINGTRNPIIRRDNRQLMIEWYSQLIRNQDDHPVGVLSVGHDVTSRVEAERKLSQYQNLLEDLVEARTKELLRINQQLEQEIEARKKVEAQLRDQSLRDHLTGLYNRRELYNRLDEEIRRSKRTEQPFSLLILDIDHFKSINDRFGHLEGDRVLCFIADCLGQTAREVDIVTRYGGEEFAIILSETSLKQAAQLAERLRRKIADSHLLMPDNSLLAITASIGVTEFSARDGSVGDIMKRADNLLYKAKNGGRNQVCQESK